MKPTAAENAGKTHLINVKLLSAFENAYSEVHIICRK